MYRLIAPVLIAVGLTSCGEPAVEQPGSSTAPMQASDVSAPLGAGYVAYTGATIWDGTGSPAQNGKSLVVRDGRIVGIFDAPPADAEIIDLGGRWVVPGFINAHGHVSGRWADDSLTSPVDRVRGDLSLYARYGITSIVSLGGAPDEAFEVRDGQERPSLSHARVRLAGPVVVGDTPGAAAALAGENIAKDVDWIKIRVDDNLGTGTKMPWDAIHEVINIARESGTPVATHIYYLEDAQRLLEMGTGLIAHSVRDQRSNARLY